VARETFFARGLPLMARRALSSAPANRPQQAGARERWGEHFMKMRLVLLWMSVVATLALALAAPAAATTGFTFTVVNQHCYGAHGQDVYFRVKLTAAGSTSANKLTTNSQSQYFSGGKWHKFYTWKQDKMSYTANGQAHSIDYSYTHEGTNQNNWRIVSKLRAWNGTHLLASKTFKSLAC
jgi:hypothetical protein